MRRQTTISILVFATIVAFAGAEEDASPCPYKTWLGRHEDTETLLETADVEEFRPVGQGVTNPWKITLSDGSEKFHGAFKPIKAARYSGYWESFEAEVAAYQLDKLLGLNMVPPTVVKRINTKEASTDRGSLQLWVEDYDLYRKVQDETPRTPGWSHELSRMKIFDVLINNEDRNAQNFMVDPHFHIVLIDHSRAFITRTRMLKNPKKLPAQFDRKLVEKLKGLTKEKLDASLESVSFEDRNIRLLRGSQIKAILERRDALLEHLQELIEERGEANVLF